MMLLQEAKQICLAFLSDKLNIKNYQFPSENVGDGWLFSIVPFSNIHRLMGVGGIYVRKDGSILELGSLFVRIACSND